MKGKSSTKVGNITITCMSEEARDLLNSLCEKFKIHHEGKDVDEVSGYQALYWACRYSGLIHPSNVDELNECKALVSMYQEDMFLAIAGTLADEKERGFHLYKDLDTVGRTSVQIGNEGKVELKLRELPFLSTTFTLISFHTHNGGNEKPSLRDITTALALGEDLLCIGCIKSNRPNITCWKVSVQKVL